MLADRLHALKAVTTFVTLVFVDRHVMSPDDCIQAAILGQWLARAPIQINVAVIDPGREHADLRASR